MMVPGVHACRFDSTALKRGRRWLIAAVLAAFATASWPASPAPAGNAIAPGSGAFDFSADFSQTRSPLKVWTYRPENFTAESSIVFVMHGVERNGRAYRDAWAAQSRRQGFLLLVPEFPLREYPGEAYQQGHIRDRAGKPLPPEAWTFSVIEKLFDHARRITGSKAQTYLLYGHSGGGQFVQRFVLFMPQARYSRAIAANPGYYTFPTADAKYPYGLGETPMAGGIPPAVFARDFVLMLGAEDTRRDADLRKTRQADAQGLTRLERGRNYFRVAGETAAKMNAAFKWRQVTVPGIGHSNARMAPAAARELFAPN